MITHYARLELNTVSVQGVKQFYRDQLQFPIAYESEDRIDFRPTAHTTLSFKEAAVPLAPVHYAFEVPMSAFGHAVNWLQKQGVTLLKWPDGRTVDEFETGRNVYFRDGDGNLGELIAHPYVKEGVLKPSGELNILYVREVGFPVDDVPAFREELVQLFNFKLDKVSELFTFAIGGTAHAVIPSKRRKWIPIAMTALAPSMTVTFGASSQIFLDQVKRTLEEKGIASGWQEKGDLRFQLGEYPIELIVTDFPPEVPALLELPFST